MQKPVYYFLGAVLTSLLVVLLLSACNYPSKQDPPASQEPLPTDPAAATPAQAAIPAEPRVLTICLRQEPASLFLYGDSSQSARSIRQAIYDGPIEVRNYEPAAVLLEDLPTLANGGVWFEPVAVQVGELLVDDSGLLTNLDEGTSYLPAGCPDFSCAAAYSGQEPVQVDQQVVRFKLKPGINWQDGEPLTASDSQFSFEIAKGLYPMARSDLVVRTFSYLTVDELTVEWRGIPGYRYSGYAAAFFPPLPEHTLGVIVPQDLLTSELSSRTPLGWGPYMIEEWSAGDHISLLRNPGYFRQAEGLPHFDRLVFRFIDDPDDALTALLAGECDYLDEGYPLDTVLEELREAEGAGKLAILTTRSNSWEHIDFGISSNHAEILPIFQSRETRQAVALCSDRQKIADLLLGDGSVTLDSFVSPDHPLVNPDVRRYSFDPSAGSELLETMGWIDSGAGQGSVRIAQGVSGIPDGTPLMLELLTADAPQNQLISEVLRDSLAKCGIGLNVKSMPTDQLFGAGQGSPIFGRNFLLAQFGWMGSWQPPCFLYTSQEIPGPYPQAPKGWGGSNPSGYSSQDFDRACWRALTTMPEEPGYQAAHHLAQAIFAEDLPSLPLFLHIKRVAVRPDLCAVQLDASADSALWNLENFNFGEGCNP